MNTVDAVIEQSAFRRNVYDMVPQGASRILDVGCGNGALLLRLGRDKGCTDLHGVEMDPALTRCASRVLDGLWHTDIEKEQALFAERAGYFDHIILHDVVEHLFDPWHTLMKIRSLGSERCTYLIATPNLHHWRLQQQILSGHFPYGPGLWHTGHLRWYTPASLVELLLIGGLEIKALYLEIPDQVDLAALLSQGEVRRVEIPPREFQAGADPERVFALEYPRSVRDYLPVFYAHKLIAVCGKGELLVEPGPMTYNCPMLAAIREAMRLPFDVYNPPRMRPLVGNWN